MREISEERLKRFWEWCGVKSETSWPLEPVFRQGHNSVSVSNKQIRREEWPELTLNNLFKWAVPRVENDWQLTLKVALGLVSVTLDECTEEDVRRQVFIVDQDPATALFLAIEKLIEEIG